MIRVALHVQGVVEVYDDAGRLVKVDQIQPATLAALSPAAAREACAGLGEQLAVFFVTAALPVESAD